MRVASKAPSDSQYNRPSSLSRPPVGGGTRRRGTCSCARPTLHYRRSARALRSCDPRPDSRHRSDRRRRLATPLESAGCRVPRWSLAAGAPEKSATSPTNAEGNFSVQFLPPGNYDSNGARPGFEAVHLEWRSGSNHRGEQGEDSTRRSALPREQVAVSAAPLIQTENATLGRVIDRTTIEELPLVDRNPMRDPRPHRRDKHGYRGCYPNWEPEGQEIRANGARSGDNNFMLNGVDANSYSLQYDRGHSFRWRRDRDPRSGHHSGVQGPDFAPTTHSMGEGQVRTQTSKRGQAPKGGSWERLLLRPQ